MIFVCVLLVAIGLYFLQINLSGNVVLELDANYFEGENLDGILKLSLNNGEFIPASSIVIFETSDQQQEFILEDVLSEQPTEGTYYIQDKNISGQGMGYGSIGIKKIYPELSFEFNLYSKTKEVGENKSKEKKPTEEVESADEEVVEESVIEKTNETELIEEETVNETSEQIEETSETETEIIDEVEEAPLETETEIIEEVIEEVEDVGEEVIEAPLETEVEEETETTKEEIKEEVKEEKQEVKEDKEEAKDKVEVAEAPTITGSIISSFFKNFLSFFQFIPTGQVALSLETTFPGTTSANEPFTYNLEKSQTAELVSGSVTDGTVALNNSEIQFEVSKDSILVSTDYFELEEGFGANYLDGELQIFEINLSAIGLNFSKGDLSIRFVYGAEDIISLSTFLQEGKIEERNKSTLLEVSEFYLQNLTDDERQILVQKFGNVSIKTTVSEVLNGRLIRNYKIGDYELVASYDYNPNEIDSLKEQMERDKLNFLRDLIRMISEEENGSENVAEFFGSSKF